MFSKTHSFSKLLIALLFVSTAAVAQEQYVTVAPIDTVAVVRGKTAALKIDCRVNSERLVLNTVCSTLVSEDNRLVSSPVRRSVKNPGDRRTR